MFYPHAPSYRNRILPSLFKSFESAKKHEYAGRITQVEHGSFTPLVFSLGDGMGFEVTVVMKKLAASLAIKQNEPYSRVVYWIRFVSGLSSLCQLTSSLLRPASTQHANESMKYCVVVSKAISN